MKTRRAICQFPLSGLGKKWLYTDRAALDKAAGILGKPTSYLSCPVIIVQMESARMRNIKSLTHEELEGLLVELGQPRFRIKQLEEWIYAKHCLSFDEMSSLPDSLRRALSSSYTLNEPTLVTSQASVDGTKKYLFSLDDGVTVESVGIPSEDGKRFTVCISSQAGCPMACSFCATGRFGFTRNLSVGEIFDQVVLASDDFGRRATNVVVMGQGEPFLNYDNTVDALKKINSGSGLGIGSRHITISTCGVIEGIQRLSQEANQFTLAVSLHSAIQATRDSIMPGVKKYPLASLRHALESYTETTGRRVSLEYAPIDKINDDDAHIAALVDFCQGLLCHVNLIPLNPVVSSSLDNTHLMRPSFKTRKIEQVLHHRGIECSIRNSRGSDIDGACGQLKQRYSKR